MAVYNGYTATFYDSSVLGHVTIPEIISLRVTTGRTRASDQWAPMTGVLRARYDAAGSFTINDIRVGAVFRWYAPGRTTTPSGAAYVKNARVIWGLPYDSLTGTGNGDEIEIEFEGELARRGRQMRTLEQEANADDYTYVSDLIATSVPDVINSEVVGPTGKINRQTTAQRLASSVEGRLADRVNLSNNPSIYLYASTDTPYATVAFSDTINDATHRAYNELSFAGLSDDYFTIVTVTPEAATSATVDRGGDDYTLDVLSWNKYTSTAQYLAEYLGEKYSVTDPRPYQLRATSAGQHTQNLDTLGVSGLFFGDLIRYRIEIEFRGATYYAQIEGAEIDANLSETTYTYYLSPDDGVGWFTLDSATLGVLDEDRLAFI